MPASSDAPNILVVMADQLTPFALGCYGHPVVKSPNIDRLAHEGVVFDAAYSSSPLCTPARYAFMTGRHVSRYGGYDNAPLSHRVPAIENTRAVNQHTWANVFVEQN